MVRGGKLDTLPSVAQWTHLAQFGFIHIPTSEDEKHAALERLAVEGGPQELLFVIQLASDTDEPWLLRAEAFRFLRDADQHLLPHEALRVTLLNVFGDEPELTVRQYAAFCVGPYLDDPDLGPVIQHRLLNDEDLRYNLLDAIKEESNLGTEIRGLLLHVQQQTDDVNLQEELADLLSR